MKPLIEYIATDPMFYVGTVFVVVVSIVLHELAHGYAAIKLGDDTPNYLGRMTPNPFVHMDIWAIVFLLLTGLTWGRMPIDPTRLRGKHGDAIVAIAGPAMNVAISFVSLTALGLLLRFPPAVPADYSHVMDNLILVLTLFGINNALLAAFNMLPVPQLDGAAVLGSFHRKFGDFASDPSQGGLHLVMFIGAAIVFRSVFSVILVAACKGYWMFVAGK